MSGFRSGWCGLDAGPAQHARCRGAWGEMPCVCDCHSTPVPTLGEVLARFDVAGLVDELAAVAAQPGETPPAVRRLVAAGAELLAASTADQVEEEVRHG